jgi:hypothetical protein
LRGGLSYVDNEIQLVSLAQPSVSAKSVSSVKSAV